MFKFKITKAQFDALSEEQQAAYTAKGDGYQLKIEGLPDFDALNAEMQAMRESQQTLLDEAKKAKSEKTNAEKAAKAAAEEAARKNGDVETLEKSWQAKLTAEQEAHAATKNRYGSQVSKLMVGNVAAELSNKLFKDKAKALEHHVLNRLQLEEGENGEFKTRVLDAEGKISALSLDDLVNEFKANDMFKPFIADTASQSISDLQRADKQPVQQQNGGPIDNLAVARQAIAEMGNS